MKTKLETPVYTAQEVVMILKAAKEQGFTSITVPGISAHAISTTTVAEVSAPAAERPPPAASNTQKRFLPPERGNAEKSLAKDEYCHCGNKMVLNRWGKLYCFQCYRAEKIKSGEWTEQA